MGQSASLPTLPIHTYLPFWKTGIKIPASSFLNKVPEFAIGKSRNGVELTLKNFLIFGKNSLTI